MSNNVIRKATNRWAKGLVMDFSPENTKNEVLTHALNATLLTFNGNELSLQNDMGNARVETAYLPLGYIPVGTCEYGGIIYIVSYNPLEDKSLIGCFPSPERNISSSELGISTQAITKGDFQKLNGMEPTGDLVNLSKKVILRQDSLNPGDKFVIYANDTLCKERLEDLLVYENNNYSKKENPLLKLSVVSIEDNGKLVYITDDVVKYEFKKQKLGEELATSYKYHILCENKVDTEQIDIDSYRNVLSSGYSVFKLKSSGQLAILLEVISIDAYSISHSIVNTKEDDTDAYFDVMLHVDVLPEITKLDYKLLPKLKYHYLQEALGFIEVYDEKKASLQQIPLYDENNQNNSDFNNTQLSTIFVSEDKSVNKDLLTLTLDGRFDFARKDLYYVKSNGLIPSEPPILTNLGVESLDSPGILDKVDAFYLPDEETGAYDSLKLGTIKLPKDIVKNGISFPFKFNYTLVPCMEYGKLELLAVSNTIDLNNLGIFESSNFTTWKYRIDGLLLRLTFGAEIFDTFERDKVSGLILEFYDWRGFAGSLEIKDKKSYSGIFTKLLDLNVPNVLSKRKLEIVNDSDNIYKYSDVDFGHNVNISETQTNAGILNEEKVVYRKNIGWCFDNSSESAEEYVLLGEYNDCGTLYSNLIYGVKAYLKVDSSNGMHCYFKKDLFLFTWPIYNEYYYTVSDFNLLENPTIPLLMTYKIENTSSIRPYENSDKGIISGYSDYDAASLYIQGKYNESSDLNLLRYYEFYGNSDLYLEVGLPKDYEVFGLACKPEINEHIGCCIQVTSSSDSNKTFDIDYNIEPSTSDLANISKLGFSREDSFASMYFLDNLRSHNFINIEKETKPTPIKIGYSFIVGYAISITDITTSTVPATTICALCHKKDDGMYNYKDFGVYEKISEDGTSTFLSEVMLYNSGDLDTEIFGVCRMLNPDGATFGDLCHSYYETTKTTSTSTTPGKFNSGAQLNSVKEYIRPYTFGLPHVHGLKEEYSTNLDVVEDYLGDKWIKLTYSDEGLSGIYEFPRYNMCFNTENSLKYGSEFISSMYISAKSTADFGIYQGLTGFDLSEYNKNLVNLMKLVYAYNPDYDLLNVNKGNYSIVNYENAFKSNLISYNCQLKSEVFNNFLQINSITIANYLDDLNTYSGINTEVGLTTFKPDFTYCGISDSTPYLINTLTYNTIIPEDLHKNLEINFSEEVVVKHHDGSYDILEGIVDNKALYGLFSNDSGKKLVQLEVNNYEINLNSGDLTVIDTSTEMKFDGTLILPNPLSMQANNINNLVEVPVKYAIPENYNGTLESSLQVTRSHIYYAYWDNGSFNAFCSNTTLKDGANIHITEYKKDNDNYVYMMFAKPSNLQGICIGSKIIAGDNISVGTIHTVGNVFYTCRQVYGMALDALYTSGGYFIDADRQTGENLYNFFNSDAIGLSKQLKPGTNESVDLPSKKDTFKGDLLINLNYTVQLPDEGYLKMCGSPHTTFNISGINNSYIGSSVIIVELRISLAEVPITRSLLISEHPGSIIPYLKTTHGDFDNDNIYKLFVLTSCTIPKTNITFNDLVYSPEKNGHRLFVRNLFRNLSKPTLSNDVIIWYRRKGLSGDSGKNALYLYTGLAYAP